MIARSLWIGLVLALLLVLPQFLAEFHLFQLCLIAGTALIVLGLVMVTGLAGQISLAQSAFAALGAYGATVLATSAGIPLWAGIVVTALATGGLGYLLGLMTLRVAGHYLALATMAVTAIVQLALIHSDAITGGAAGLAVPPFGLFGLELTTGRQLYYVIVPSAALFFLAVERLLNSHYGRAFAAIRQSETAAEAMGLDVLRYKAAAFGASAFLGALGGGLLAPLSSYLDPAQFGITQSVYYLAVAVVGGMASPLGAIVGSAVFVLLPDLLQGFQTYLGLVFALLLLGFIVLRPNGLASLSIARLWSWPRRAKPELTP